MALAGENVIMDLTPLIEASAHAGGAIVLAGWALASHSLKLNSTARDLVQTALLNAVLWAESEIGELSKAHLDDVNLKNQFLDKAMEYMATHVPSAMKRLKLDDVEVEEKLIVALSRHVGWVPAVLGTTDPVPAGAPAEPASTEPAAVAAAAAA